MISSKVSKILALTLVMMLSLFVSSGYMQDAKTKVSMDFEKAELRDVLKAFSRQTGFNFISSDIIENKQVTVCLNNVPIEDALSSMLEANGLLYEKEPGNVYLIKPSGTENIRTVTRVFKLNYLQVYKMAEEVGTTASTSGITIIGEPSIASAGSTSTTQTSTSTTGTTASTEEDQPKNIIQTIRSLMSKHGKIVADRRNNSLVITDIPNVFPSIEATIRELDVEPVQIMIQAEIIETTTTALKRIGLEYGSETQLLKLTYTGSSSTSGGNANTTSPTFPTAFPFTENFIKDTYNTSLAQSGLFRYGTIRVGDIDLVLKLLAQDEDTKYLSRPKIMTINNEPAIIRITANTAIGTISSSVTQTGQTITTPERAETGIQLKVTPQVNAKGDIFMFLEPSVSRAVASTTFSNTMNPSYRSSASTVMVNDGDTVFVGGLIGSEDSKATRKIPWLGDLPFVGEPFKSHYKKGEDTELLIFVTPHIVQKRDGQIIVPKDMTEREHMLKTALENYSKKGRKTDKKTEPIAKSEKESAAREAAMQKTLDKYSKKSKK